MTERPTPALLLAVLVGGAAGGLLRWGAGEVVPDGAGFPQTVLAVNVLGSFLLALLPAVGSVRRRPVLVAGLGPGLLGGFTTLSTATEQTRALATDRPLLALTYAVATLAACVLAVALATALTAGARRRLDEAGAA